MVNGEAPSGACPVCGSADAVRVRAYGQDRAGMWGGRSVARGPSCGVGFVDPMPTADDLAGYYADSSYESGHGGMRSESGPWSMGMARAATQAELVAPWTAATGVSWLDVGAGYGFLLDEARRRGAVRTAAVELTPERVADLERKGHQVAGSLAEVAGRFDVVSMSHFLEHAPDPVAVLAEVKERLAPGGVLFVEVPNEVSLEVPAADVPHVVFFDAGSLEVALGRAELEPVTMVECGPADGWRNAARGKLVGAGARLWPAAPRSVVRRVHWTGVHGGGRSWLRAVARVV